MPMSRQKKMNIIFSHIILREEERVHLVTHFDHPQRGLHERVLPLPVHVAEGDEEVALDMGALAQKEVARGGGPVFGGAPRGKHVFLQ